MRKIVFLGVLLFMAVPAMAGVVISCSDDDVNKITISYDANGGTLIRAFGLDIAADTNIVGVEVLDPNYRIYPGQIEIEDGVVTNPGDPYDACDIGDLDLTIEMGSLYADDDPDFNHPPAGSGDLIAIILADGPDDVNYTIDVNTLRGGVVLEDPDEDPCTVGLPCGGTLVRECYTGPQPTEWAKVGKPQCWCNNINPRQCLGDVDGVGQGKKKNIYVSTWDVEVYRLAVGKTESQLTISTPCDMTAYDANPSCTSDVCDVLLICADVDHLGSGKKKDIRVSTTDTPVFRARALDPAGNNGVADLPDDLCQ